MQPPSPEVEGLLEKHRLSRHEIARRSGLSLGHVSRLVSGERGPSVFSMLALVVATGIPAEPLLRALAMARSRFLKRRKVERLLR